MACWLDPHWRSTVVPGTLSGNPAASAALRPTFKPCSPTWLTQPTMTSSISPASMPVRLTSAASTSAIKSTGCQSFNRPFLRPTAVRAASTITASRCAMTLLLACLVIHYISGNRRDITSLYELLYVIGTGFASGSSRLQADLPAASKIAKRQSNLRNIQFHSVGAGVDDVDGRGRLRRPLVAFARSVRVGRKRATQASPPRPSLPPPLRFIPTQRLPAYRILLLPSRSLLDE